MVENPFDRENDSLELRVTQGLAKIGLALKSQAWQGAEFQGLTPTQGQILVLLRTQPKTDMRLSTVARGLAITPATASDAVTTLVEKGLVQKGKAADDGRAIAITLTPKGRQEADRAASWPDFLLGAVEALSAEEQAVFLRGLIKMIQRLQERGQIPVASMCVTCQYFRPHVYKDAQRPHHCAFVDAPFGDRDLRLDCPDHVAGSAS